MGHSCFVDAGGEAETVDLNYHIQCIVGSATHGLPESPAFPLSGCLPTVEPFLIKPGVYTIHDLVYMRSELQEELLAEEIEEEMKKGAPHNAPQHLVPLLRFVRKFGDIWGYSTFFKAFVLEVLVEIAQKSERLRIWYE